MIFNAIDLTPYLRIKSIRGRGMSGNELTLINVPGMDGAHLSKKKRPVRILVIEADIRDESREDLRINIDKLNGILSVDEPVPISFPDEMNITYYGIPEATNEGNEYTFLHQGQLTIVCPDSYKYGPDKTAIFPQDAVTLTNEGTAEADPIFELEVLQPVTFAMIQNQDDQYQMIGNPTAAEQSEFQRETRILHDPMSNLTGWAQGTFVDNGYVAGEMATDGGAFIVSAYGSAMTPYAWQGPARKRSLSEVVQDFQADILVEQMNTVGQTGMIEIYFLDASNNTVAKIGIEDVWRDRSKVQGKFQLGSLDNRKSIYVQSDIESGWNNFDGIIRVVREGNVWRPYWAKIDSNGNHVWRKSTESYVDVEEEYMSPIAQIQVAMRKWPATDNITQKVKDIKVWKINSQDEDQVPYIANEGDVITFDHKNDDILINGEDRTDLKAFGGQYFKLIKGINQLIVQPSDSFSTRVKYRERFR